MTSTPPEPRTAATPPELSELSALAGLDLAGVSVERVLRAGEKSLLVAGHRDGLPVVVKALTTHEGFWRAKLAHEIAIYRALADTPAPVPTPTLLHTDGASVLVIAQLPGRPLNPDRYPQSPVPAAALSAALDAVVGFSGWNPPAGVLTPVFDYPDRVERYHHDGVIDVRARAVLHQLLARLGAPDRPAHGDPMPANLLLDTTDAGVGRCALLDFEFTGLFLPGFDLAMLHTLLSAIPGAQTRIAGLASAAGIAEAFLVNRAIVLSRELRIHRELDDGPLRRERLALLVPQWQALTHELHALQAAH